MKKQHIVLIAACGFSFFSGILFHKAVFKPEPPPPVERKNPFNAFKLPQLSRPNGQNQGKPNANPGSSAPNTMGKPFNPFQQMLLNSKLKKSQEAKNSKPVTKQKSTAPVPPPMPPAVVPAPPEEVPPASK